MPANLQPDAYAAAKIARQKCVDAVVNTPAPRKLVAAGPGTGKTYLFRDILKGKKDALTLTFVNALVDDLSLRLFGLSDVMTLHSYALRLLGKNLKGNFKVHPSVRTVITEDARVLLGKDIDFEALIKSRADKDPGLAFYRKRRRYYGHYWFTDAVYAAVLYLERHGDAVLDFSHLVVDEFQDFSELEVHFLELLTKKRPVLLVGDDDQALYAFKDASPKYIRERHCGAVAGYRCFELPYCSRSTKVIVEATNDVLRRAAAEGHLTNRIEKDFRYFPEDERDAQSAAFPHVYHYGAYHGMVASIIRMRVAELARQLHTEFGVLIIAPFHKQCHGITKMLQSYGFADVHYDSKRDEDEPSLLDGIKLLLADEKSNLGWRICAKQLQESSEFKDLLVRTDSGGANMLCDLVDSKIREPVGEMLSVLGIGLPPIRWTLS